MENNLTCHEAKLVNSLSLAFLGDSVYELYVRDYLVRGTTASSGKIQPDKVKLVCAEFQAEIAEEILSELDETEFSVYKRGRNAKGLNIPKHATESEYRKATGLEALLGYLYLTGNIERINYIMSIVWENR